MVTVIPIKPVQAPEFGRDAEGWERLSTLSEPRLSEMVENYKALGYEVQVRDRQSTEGGCSTCFDAGSAMGQVFGTLFIRRTAVARRDDELFD